MRPAARIALVVVGLAASVYGVASVTGQWLGTPPWWERAAPLSPEAWLRRKFPRFHPVHVSSERSNPEWGWHRAVEEAPTLAPRNMDPIEGRKWVSGCLVLVGVALAAFGSWSHRRVPKHGVASPRRGWAGSVRIASLGLGLGAAMIVIAKFIQYLVHFEEWE